MRFARYAMEPAGPYDHPWPEGSEFYPQTYFGTVLSWGKAIRVRVCVGEREAFGRERRRIIVDVNGKAAAEFAATDDYSETGHVSAVLKWQGENKHVRWEEWHPSRFPSLARFSSRILRHRDRISPGGFNSGALCVPETDGDVIVDFALLRAQEKGWV